MSDAHGEQHSNSSRKPFRGKDGFRIPLDFDNSSDYLFARLFLSDDSHTCIPWKYCDTLLSVLRDSRFDARDVTFEDCGDMYRRVGEYRDRAWRMVETRSQTITMPQVILDGVFDILRLELESDWLIRTEAGTTDMLKKMALVHSTWHGKARRLLGFAIGRVQFRALRPNLLQAPSIGQWARALGISVHFRLEDSSFADANREHLMMLRNLCSRVNCIRLLRLDVLVLDQNATPFSSGFMEELYKTFSSLTHIEQLIITVPCVQPVLIQLVSEAHRKTLRSICFNLRTWDENYVKADLPEPFARLTTLPNLNSIRIVDFSSRSRLPIIDEIMWSRDPSESNTFISSRINIQYNWRSKPRIPQENNNLTESADVRDMLQSCRLVDFSALKVFDYSQAYPEEHEMANAIAPIVKWCTSAHKIEFRDFPWSHMKIFDLLHQQAGVPKSVRELRLVSSPPLPHPADSHEESLEKCAFPLYDAHLAQALGKGFAPGLQRLAVVFTEYRPFLNRRYKSGKQTFNDCAIHYAGLNLGRKDVEELEGPDLYVQLLPQCKQKCAERGIMFKVDCESD